MLTTREAGDTAARYLAAALRGRSRKLDAVTIRVRKAGVPLPMGAGNGKTGAPGTYRPVGPTCPESCPQLPSNGGGCFADTGHSGTHTRRSNADAADAVRAAMAAIVAAHVGGVGAARLQVGGDFGRTDADVDEYARGLLRGLRAVRIVLGRTGPGDVLAWSYTHHPRMNRWIGLLRAAGLHVRRSDHGGTNGAIVLGPKWEGLAEARARIGAPVAKCPAQLRDVTCVECRLCWTRPDVVIAFAAHGTGAAKAHAATMVQPGGPHLSYRIGAREST